MAAREVMDTAPHEIIIERVLDSVGGGMRAVIDLHPHAQPHALRRRHLALVDAEPHRHLETVEDRGEDRAHRRSPPSRAENITSLVRGRKRWPLSTNRFCPVTHGASSRDRKSTRLNSSHYCASRTPSSACKKKET